MSEPLDKAVDTVDSDIEAEPRPAVQESADAQTPFPELADTSIAPPHGYKRWKRKSFSQGLMEAYHRLGGIEYLVWFGRNYPADFVRACSRMIPQEIRNSIGAEVTIIHTIPRTALDNHPVERPIADPLGRMSDANEEN